MERMHEAVLCEACFLHCGSGKTHCQNHNSFYTMHLHITTHIAFVKAEKISPLLKALKEEDKITTLSNAPCTNEQATATKVSVPFPTEEKQKDRVS